jgi:hypothetical protein
VFNLRFSVWCLCRGLLSLKHIGPYSVKAVESLIVPTSFEVTGYVLNTTTGRQMKVELTTEMFCVLNMNSCRIVKIGCASDASC